MSLASDQAIVCLDCVLSAASSEVADACNGSTAQHRHFAPLTPASVPNQPAQFGKR